MRTLLTILVGFVAAATFVAGTMLLTAPYSYVSELMEVLWGPLIFEDWLLPGIVVTLLVGLAHLAAFLACLAGGKNSYRITLYAGSLLSLWMVVLLAFTPGFYPLHFIFLVIGLLIVLAAYHLLGKMAY
ncbi:MAG: hypothetical protein ACO1NX_02155 [Chitinophagaceae bacterium]